MENGCTCILTVLKPGAEPAYHILCKYALEGVEPIGNCPPGSEERFRDPEVGGVGILLPSCSLAIEYRQVDFFVNFNRSLLCTFIISLSLKVAACKWNCCTFIGLAISIKWEYLRFLNF